MSFWGIFVKDGEVHVVPVDDGDVATAQPKEPHFTDVMCFCEPDVTLKRNSILIVHKDEN